MVRVVCVSFASVSRSFALIIAGSTSSRYDLGGSAGRFSVVCVFSLASDIFCGRTTALLSAVFNFPRYIVNRFSDPSTEIYSFSQSNVILFI